jgi:hypothetical protein
MAKLLAIGFSKDNHSSMTYKKCITMSLQIWAKEKMSIVCVLVFYALSKPAVVEAKLSVSGVRFYLIWSYYRKTRWDCCNAHYSPDRIYPWLELLICSMPCLLIDLFSLNTYLTVDSSQFSAAFHGIRSNNGVIIGSCHFWFLSTR